MLKVSYIKLKDCLDFQVWGSLCPFSQPLQPEPVTTFCFDLSLTLFCCRHLKCYGEPPLHRGDL